MKIPFFLFALLILVIIPFGHAVGDNMTERLFYPEYWYQQGVSEYLLGNFDKAVSLLDVAVEQNPNLADAWYWRGFALKGLGESEEGDKSIEKAKELDPMIDNAYNRRIGPLAGLQVNPVPAERAQVDEEDTTTPQKIQTNIDLSKHADPTGPDMVITSLEPVVRNGSLQLEIKATVKNQGYKATQDFFLTFYLSKDGTINTEDTAIGYYLIPDMKAGTEKTITGYYPMETMTPGTYYLGAIADQGNEIMEVSEDNNVMVASSKITIPDVKSSSYKVSTNPYLDLAEKVTTDSRFEAMQKKPDLLITKISAPESVNQGGKLPVNVTVKNEGTLASGPFRISLYLTPDALITDKDKSLGYGDIEDLGVGMMTEGSAVVNIPENLSPGQYYIGILIDSQDLVSESNENNNLMFADKRVEVISSGSSKLTLPATPVLTNAPVETVTTVNNVLPDLIPMDLWSDETGKPGSIINVTTNVKNQGNSDAGKFIVDLYLSKDTTLSDEDILLGMGEIPNLPANSQTIGEASAPIPQNLTPGNYYFGVIVDGEHVINETNETNNIGFAEIPVTIK